MKIEIRCLPNKLLTYGVFVRTGKQGGRISARFKRLEDAEVWKEYLEATPVKPERLQAIQ